MPVAARDWRTSPLQRAQVAAIARLGYPLVNMLGRTLRWRVEGVEHFDAIVASGRQPVMAFWHGRILSAAYYFRHRGIVVISSRNFDGEWTARIVERFGFRTARGSTSRGARKAMLQMKRHMAAGRPTGFTVDGPRGPARVAKPGAVWLAMVTGNPVLPFHLEASSHWTVDSWDRTQIPRPFSTVALAVGTPIHIPEGLDDEGLERARVGLEQQLTALEATAVEMLRR